MCLTYHKYRKRGCCPEKKKEMKRKLFVEISNLKRLLDGALLFACSSFFFILLEKGFSLDKLWSPFLKIFSFSYLLWCLFDPKKVKKERESLLSKSIWKTFVFLESLFFFKSENVSFSLFDCFTLLVIMFWTNLFLFSLFLFGNFLFWCLFFSRRVRGKLFFLFSSFFENWFFLEKFGTLLVFEVDFLFPCRPLRYWIEICLLL